jgi:uncharacterized Tic20 family protein
VREVVSAAQSGEDPARFLGPVMTLHFVVMIVLIAVYFLPPVIAAVATSMGRDFRYPILGNRLAHYLGYDSAKKADGQTWLIEEYEDRWVVSMGHFSVIIALWGILAPLTAWILQGKRSFFLKFQSIQALVFQTSVMLLYLLAGVIYVFGFMAFILTVGIGGDESGTSGGMIGLAILFISMLVAMFIVLLIPSFHILGQWAGYRVLKGDNYRYALIGRLVEKWTAGNSLSASDTDVMKSKVV